jgi:type II secretory pathway pseudopilin PulG
VARNALIGFALLAALAGCSPSGDAAEAQAAEAQLAALRAHNDSLRQARSAATAAPVATDSGARSTLAATTAGMDTVRHDSVTVAEGALADSIQKAREIEVMRETFA